MPLGVGHIRARAATTSTIAPRAARPQPADDAGRRQLDRRPRQPADLRCRQSWLASGSATRPAATIAPCSISASRGCSPTSLWRAATAATPRLLRALAALDLLSSTTGPRAARRRRPHDLLEILRIATTRRSPSSPASSGRSMAPLDRLPDHVFDRLVHRHRQRESMRRTANRRKPEPVALWTCRALGQREERCPIPQRATDNEDLKPRFKVDHAASRCRNQQARTPTPRATSNVWWARSSRNPGRIKSVHPGEIIGIAFVTNAHELKEGPPDGMPPLDFPCNK